VRVRAPQCRQAAREAQRDVQRQALLELRTAAVPYLPSFGDALAT
jgi:hypothetical protein